MPALGALSFFVTFDEAGNCAWNPLAILIAIAAWLIYFAIEYCVGVVKSVFKTASALVKAPACMVPTKQQNSNSEM